MFDYDAVIIGAGPAGLTTGIYLGRAGRRVIVLEKETFGGPIVNYELIENYPGFDEGVSGAALASQMVNQATKYGLQFEMVEVTGVSLYSNCRFVKCAGGEGYTAGVVIIAGGARHKKLGVPGEETFRGKGVFNCAFCDAGQYANKTVVVCGGGDAGITEASYMTKYASDVILIEARPEITAGAILKKRAETNPKLKIRTGTRLEAILGHETVEAVQIIGPSGAKETLPASGVLVDIGLDANSGFVKNLVALDNQGRIIVNEKMETKVPYILAAGDVRSGSPNQVVTATGDGATAAITAEKLLQSLPVE